MNELFGTSGAASAPKGKNNAAGGGVKSGDVEMQAVSAEGGSNYADVFSDIGAIKKMITQINGAAEELLTNTQSYKTAPNQKVEAEIKDEVQLIIARTRPVCLKAKDKLKEQKGKLGAAGLDHAEKRMRQQMFRATAKAYIDSVKRYQESQADYESAVRDSASRRLRIVDPTMTDEDIEYCIDEGRAEQVFQKVIREGRSGQLANTYKGVAAQREVRESIFGVAWISGSLQSSLHFPFLLPCFLSFPLSFPGLSCAALAPFRFNPYDE